MILAKVFGITENPLRRAPKESSADQRPSLQNAGILLAPVGPITGPFVSGKVEMGIFRHFDSDAILIGRAKAPDAFPSRTVIRINEICVLRHLDRLTSLADRAKPAVTSPSSPIGRIDEVCVSRHYDADATVILFAIALFAFPGVTQVVQICVGRYFNWNAGTLDGGVASVACPAEAQRRICQIPVRRYLYCTASPGDPPITSVAFPPVAGGVQIGIGRYSDGHAGLAGLQITSTTLPTTSVGGICGIGILRHLNCFAGAFDRTIATITSPVAPEGLGMGVL